MVFNLTDEELDTIINYSNNLGKLEEKLIMIRDNIANIRIEFNNFTNKLILSKGGDPKNKYQIDIETGQMVLYQNHTIELPFLSSDEMDEV